MPSGRPRGGINHGDPGPDARIGLDGDSSTGAAFLFEQGRRTPALAIDHKTTPIGMSHFDISGRFIIGASPLGTGVTVCDLQEIQRRLATVDLGW
jgi:hypothetical protein